MNDKRTNQATRTQRPDDADETRTVRIGLPPHVQERMRKLYGEPGSGLPSERPDDVNPGCFRTLTGWIGRQIGR